MSWFGGGGKSDKDKDVDSRLRDVLNPNEQKQLAAARFEIEAQTELLNKILDVCFTKCVQRYSDTELQVGEMTCLDRCVQKYIQTQTKIGSAMQMMQQQQMQQMQQMQAAGAMPPSAGPR